MEEADDDPICKCWSDSEHAEEETQHPAGQDRACCAKLLFLKEVI